MVSSTFLRILIFEVLSRDVSKEKLDLNSIQKVFSYSELLSAYKSDLLLWNMFILCPGNGVFCAVEQEPGLRAGALWLASSRLTRGRPAQTLPSCPEWNYH